MDWTRLLLTFMAYGFLGWLMESTYVSLKSHHWVNRGFLKGPICPIYGVGALLILLILQPLAFSWPLVFWGGLLLCSSLEYVTGLGMEKLFGNRWWDYSDNRWNLHGRICLSVSLAWGALSLFLVYSLAPVVDFGLSRIPDRVAPWIALALAAGFVVDLVFSILAVRPVQPPPRSGWYVDDRLEIWQSAWVDNLANRSESTTHAAQDLLETIRDRANLIRQLGIAQRRLLRAFPRLQSIRYPHAHKQIRTWLETYRPSLPVLLRPSLPTLPGLPALPRLDLSRLILRTRIASVRIPDTVSHQLRHLIGMTRQPVKTWRTHSAARKKRPSQKN